MSKKVIYLITLYIAIKNRVIDLANREADVTDEVFDRIFSEACRDTGNLFKVHVSTIRDKASLRKTGVTTSVLKEMIKNYLTGKSKSFEYLVNGLLGKQDDPAVVLLMLKTI